MREATIVAHYHILSGGGLVPEEPMFVAPDPRWDIAPGSPWFRLNDAGVEMNYTIMTVRNEVQHGHTSRHIFLVPDEAWSGTH